MSELERVIARNFQYDLIGQFGYIEGLRSFYGPCDQEYFIHGMLINLFLSISITNPSLSQSNLIYISRLIQF